VQSLRGPTPPQRAHTIAGRAGWLPERDTDTARLVGAGIVGPNAGDLISECALAIEMGADAHDIGLTIHPHPTLSETVAFAAEAYAGTLTDLYMPKR